MAADGMQRLELKDLDAVLERAKAERWTELGLIYGKFIKVRAASSIHSERSAARVFILSEPLCQLPASLIEIDSLNSLSLLGNRIDDTGIADLAKLASLASLDLSVNRISNIGAGRLAALEDLTSLNLWRNRIGNAGAAEVARLSKLNALDLGSNLIDDMGAAELTGLSALTWLNLWENRVGDAGAAELAGLSGLKSLSLSSNRIGEAGARAILDAWANPATSDRRRLLDLRNNGDLSELLPAEVLAQTDAQVIIAAWRQRHEQAVGQAPSPMPESAGEPVSHGVQVGTAADGRLTLVDPGLGTGARTDAIGRELHGEVILALDRLIAAVGQNNAVAEWREVAEAVKERLGGGPAEVRVSAILRIERLRSLREADERRRVVLDPLVEPAEAGVAAALRDAVAAANLYVETDPHLAEQQRRLADPAIDVAIAIEEAEAAEAEMAALDIADPALLAELRVGRETAASGGRAGGRALAWLAGSWRNVVREMLRQVLAWVREQAKAARASAGGVAMQAQLGTVITIEEGRAALAAMGRHGKSAAAAIGKTGARGARLSGRAFAISSGTAAAPPFLYGWFAWLENQFAILPRLGFGPEFVSKMHTLLCITG